MFRVPGFTDDEKILEIVTPEWQYFDTDEYNYDESKIVPVKEQRRMGTQRGNKTTPQAPALEVRAKGLPPVIAAVRCRLWNFGSCLDHEPPKHDGSASQLTMLRANVQIEVTENVAVFGSVQDDGYRYARLRCFITRGARVQCRKFHIAFMLDCVTLPDGVVVGQDESNFAIGNPIEGFPWTRSSRMSISEKAMCPRLHDKTKRKPKGSKDGNSFASSTPNSMIMDDGNKRYKKDDIMLHDGASSSSSIQQQRKNNPKIKKEIPTPPKQGLPSLGMMGHPPPPVNQTNPMGVYHNPISYLDRHMRMSRFSFPGLDEEMFQNGGVGPDDGELVNMETALSHGRRPSNYHQYWPSYSTPQNFYLNPNQSTVSNQGNGHSPLNNSGTNPTGNQSPLMSPGVGGSSFPLPSSLQNSFSEFQNGVELSQRRLSSGAGQWGGHDLTHRRLSTVVGDPRLSASPLSPHQPGRGLEWDALFEAHAKVLALDKSSPDYSTKKNAFMAEVYRAAEMVETKVEAKVLMMKTG